MVVPGTFFLFFFLLQEFQHYKCHSPILDDTALMVCLGLGPIQVPLQLGVDGDDEDDGVG